MSCSWSSLILAKVFVLCSRQTLSGDIILVTLVILVNFLLQKRKNLPSYSFSPPYNDIANAKIVIIVTKSAIVLRFEEEEEWRSIGWASDYEVRLWPKDNISRRLALPSLSSSPLSSSSSSSWCAVAGACSTWPSSNQADASKKQLSWSLGWSTQWEW